MAPSPDGTRVIVVIDSLDQGGAEQSMMASLPPLRRQGIDASLMLLRSVSPEREAAMEAADVPVRVIGPVSGPLDLARRLRPILKQERPDLLHVALFDPIIGGALAAIGTDVPVLASQAITPPETGKDRPVDTSGSPWKVRIAVEVEAFVTRHLVTHLHAVTPGVRDVVSARFRIPKDRITVAERGRDAARFHPPTPLERAEIRAELGVDADSQVVVLLGRHEPSKGFGDMVGAVQRLAPSRPGLRVLLAGREGTATQALRSSIAAAGLEDQILLLGDRPDPERILAAGDVFLLSSRREGTSGATIEAMATALPTVATQLPGLAGILVDGEQALLVPVGDSAAMARAVARVLDDPELGASLGAAGLRTFEQRFELEQSVRALGSLYRRIAAEGR